ncbi:serine/threonine-protein kinase PLK4-like [Dendronephthya gigantea]|uniref:serine/threonine-protein kinase PLK4-like n=1 Tax=Dendronephthya gigantea TaxID=151771 RepID=UPI00106D06E5|nr:serine/threonine-protein kinase PLK4-like [Dendronephthya gigantea]
MNPCSRSGSDTSGDRDSIENYEVLDLLGRGGFACVYRARCLSTSQGEVAIKMIDKKHMKDSGLVKRVKNEVEIHCQLKHPSILELFSFFEDPNYVYLVVELCENGEVNRFMKKTGKPFSESQVRKIMSQVVNGLLYLHSHGILHRDLTLANLLLTKDMSVKIGDFGLATQLQLPNEKHYTMCGTPNFISPEVATRGPHGMESDVWSVGCMLYTLLVGKPPFETEAVKRTLNKVVLGDYSIPDNISPEARDLITKLLKKNPGDRLPLSGILDHPFILGKRNLMEKNLSAEILKSQSSNGKKRFDSSIDSGNSTMATMYGIPTGITNPNQSRGSLHSNTKPVYILPRARSEEDWPRRNPFHPSSPPVRERSSHNSSTSASHFSYDCDTAPTCKQPLHSTSWLSDISQKLKKQCKPSTENKVTSSHNHSSAPELQHVSHDEGASSSHWSKTFSANKHAPRSNNNDLSRRSNQWSSSRKDDIDSYRYDHETEKQRHENHHSRSNHGEAVSTSKNAMNRSCDSYSRRVSDQHEEKQKKTKSISDIVEPLNAQRLKPIRQKARNAVVSITETNDVCLEFLQQRDQQCYVIEVIRISSNGMKITTFFPNGKKGVLLTSEPPQSHSKSAATYLYCSLPFKYWKKYQYAARFVDLVRKKTPKITIYTKLAKSMLMENSPNADFEACFYDGAKIHQSRECTRIINPSGVSYTLESIGGKDGIPHDMRSSVEHMQSVYEQCLHLDRVLTAAEEECQEAQFFPVILCRRAVSSQATPGGHSQRNSNSRSSANGPSTPTSPCTVAQLSTMKSFNGKIGTTHDFSTMSITKSSPTMSHNNEVEVSPQRKNHLIANSSTWESRSKISEPEAKVLKSVFVADVGWSSQLSNGEIWMQYNDGSQLLVNPEAGLVKYTDEYGAITKFAKKDRIPNNIKTKLAGLPDIIELFISPAIC